MKIFVVAPFLPRPDQNSGELRFFAILEILARDNEVDLYAWYQDRSDPADTSKYRSLVESKGVRVVSCVWKALATRYYDVGLFEFYHSARHLLDVFVRNQPGARTIVDSVDIHFARELRGAELGLIDWDEAKANRESELTCYRACDAVVVVSDPDREILAREAGIPAMFVVPNIVGERARASGKRAPEVLFVGGFSHAPNVDGILWFVKDVWPGVRASHPGARLRIVGSHTPREVFALAEEDGIDVAGYVYDLGPSYDRSAVAIAPLRWGAGLKGKVCEAMASGVPVVATSIGAEGIGGTSGEELCVADDPSRFGEAICELLRSDASCERMGLAGQRLIRELCSPDAVAGRIRTMLGRVIDAKNGVVPPVGWWIRSTEYHVKASARACLRAVGLLSASRRVRARMSSAWNAR